jgi:DNA gyrase subunit A
MKFDEEGDSLVSVQVCREDHDVFLALRNGKCIRFPVPEVRVFKGRSSSGIRGVRLDKDDEVISMSILEHSDFDAETRASYVKMAKALRRDDDVPEADDDKDEESPVTRALTDAEFKRLSEKDQMILTITEAGFGKRTSSYEYRTTHRGGSGIVNIKLGSKGRNVVSSFPVADSANILMITDGGKMIRLGLDKVRIAGRSTMGVILFKTDKDEKVVATALVDGDGNDGDGVGNGDEAAASADNVAPDENHAAE